LIKKYIREKFQYTITVQNTGDEKKSTGLTVTFTTGTKGGALVLTQFNMTCPSEATCTLLNADPGHIKISLTDIPAHSSVRVSYHMLPERDKIPQDEISYFTNTATLLNGSSARVTVGVEGIGKDLSSEPERRPERPRSRDQ
jgi:hypothetical protein